MKYFTTLTSCLLLTMMGCTTWPTQAVQTRPDYVVLLHGLGRTSYSMKYLEYSLAAAGFQVLNLDYPSTKYPIEQLVNYLEEKITQSGLNRRDGSKVHFVTHSLGGILVRGYLKQQQLPRLGRVVMLSPPNQGSELADQLRNNRFYQWATGPAGQQLGTESSSFPNQLGPVEFELGVITGNNTLNPLYSSWIPGEDDGKVSVARAKVAGMLDFLVVPHSHTWIMNSREVIAQVIYFLDTGSFFRSSTEHGNEKNVLD